VLGVESVKHAEPNRSFGVPRARHIHRRPCRLSHTSQVAERFFGGCSTQTVRNYVKEGLPAHRVVRTLYFDPVEVREWIRTRSAQPPDPTGDAYRAAIKKLVDAAPELTADQAAKIRAVLIGGAA
jgi:hypothetical protein